MNTKDLATVCAEHLAQEEQLLVASLSILNAVQTVFDRHGPANLLVLAQHHADLTQQIEEVQRRRRMLRASLAEQLRMPANEIHLGRVVADVPGDEGAALRARLERVRRTGEKVAAINQRLSVQLRIYLEAYQRLLRDLTGSTSGSGRYGPMGRTESVEYRPLLHVHG